jgi:4'-phosphopantetheinyl transferase
MPLEKIVVDTERAWALWKINEDEKQLASELESTGNVPDNFTNVLKRLEWLAGRVATKAVMKALNLTFYGITKDEFGKPFPILCDFHLSLSHSYPYAAVLMDNAGPVGIDLEQPKEKLLKIAHRIHHQRELHDLGTDIVKHCIYWCAKESMIKLYGKKDLIFAENMFIQPFQRKDEGNITGKFIIGDTERIIPLHYVVYPSFIVVQTCRNHE